MSVLPQGGRSHGIGGTDSELTPRPYESIGLQRTCIALHPPKTRVSATTTSQNGLGFREGTLEVTYSSSSLSRINFKP